MQYLYLIKCQQYYKIGVANDVHQRLAQLATGNPFDLDVLALYNFESANTVEAALHQRFANKKKRGEWFELADNDVRLLKDVCVMLGGYVPEEVPTVGCEDVDAAEEIQESISDWGQTGAKWDYAAMFADGWRMERTTSKGVNDRYWCWRKGWDSSGRKYIYGGTFASLPYPNLDEMRRRYGGRGE